MSGSLAIGRYALDMCAFDALKQQRKQKHKLPPNYTLYINIKCSSSVYISCSIVAQTHAARAAIEPNQFPYRLRKIGNRVASTAKIKNQRQFDCLATRPVAIFWAYQFPRRTTKYELHSFTKVPSLLIIASSDIVKHV